jgi:predicted transcriptional regulator
MSTTQFEAPTTRSTDVDVPDDLRSAESKLVYLFLTASGGATIDELQSALGLRKISLFPVLDGLSNREYVARDGAQYVADD